MHENMVIIEKEKKNMTSCLLRCRELACGTRLLLEPLKIYNVKQKNQISC